MILSTEPRLRSCAQSPSHASPRRNATVQRRQPQADERPGTIGRAPDMERANRQCSRDSRPCTAQRSGDGVDSEIERHPLQRPQSREPERRRAAMAASTPRLSLSRESAPLTQRRASEKPAETEDASRRVPGRLDERVVARCSRPVACLFRLLGLLSRSRDVWTTV